MCTKSISCPVGYAAIHTAATAAHDENAGFFFPHEILSELYTAAESVREPIIACFARY